MNTEKDRRSKGHAEYRLKIRGMDCPDCALTIEKSILKIPGIASVKVDFMKEMVTAIGDGIHIDDLEKDINSLGYRTERLRDSSLRKDSIYVADMDCADEEKTIRKALGSVNTVSDVQFNLLERKISVFHSGKTSELLKAIEREGFKARLLDSRKAVYEKALSTWKLWSVAAAAGLIVLGGVFSILGFPGLIFKSIILAGIIIGGWKIGQKGLIAARKLRLDMNSLMSTAVIGAILIGEWLEAGVVIVLFAMAQLLESYSLDRSRRAMRALMNISPKTATIIRDGREWVVSVDEVEPGDIAVVKPGELIPVDGNIISGDSAVDQATITGESLPAIKTIGDSVYAGTINGEGALEIKTLHSSGDTTLDRIILLVEEAQAKRAPSQSFVDKFAEIYTPSVVGIAAIMAFAPPLFFGGGWIDWIYRALTLLVIACPCALVISTPVTIVSALAGAARKGVLIKGGAFLENLHNVKAMAFDKTGTITKGIPAVRDVVPLADKEPKEIIRLAASVERRSEHPIGAAIVRYAEESGISVETPDGFTSIPGKGASGIIEGTKIFIGNRALFRELGLCNKTDPADLDRIENESQTAVFVGTADKILGIIAIADEIRSEAAPAISDLKADGVKHIAMLTGDNYQTANAIGSAAGVDEIYAELLPEMKVDTILSIKSRYGSVVMVGDGVNDAPALASSTIGIAMGAVGSDVALETADIALMSDDLSKIPWAYRLSKKARGIIVANISAAIGIKAAFIVLAALGLATLWMAVFADMGISLMVIVNGLRALHSE